MTVVLMPRMQTSRAYEFMGVNPPSFPCIPPHENAALMVGYNHSFRYIMNYHSNCSASGMFVFNNTIRTCVHNLGAIRRPVRKKLPFKFISTL